MSKEKKRTRASRPTSCSVIDSSDLEQSTIPTEFTEFVRNAFDKMGVKWTTSLRGSRRWKSSLI